MARPMRGHPIAGLQQEGTKEPQTNPSVPWQEEQSDAAEGEVIACYDLDIDYKPEGSDPEIKAVKEVEENSNTEDMKMEATLSWDIVLENKELQGCRKDQAVILA